MQNHTQDFINQMKRHVPKFDIAFKEDSKFMKFLGALLFFNKDFMTRYTTTIGYKVYLPSKEKYNNDPNAYLSIMVHEFVHAMDYKKYNILFKLTYLLPQLLVVAALLSLLAIWFSKLWLLSLLAVLLLAPLPAYFRSYWELRGYTMSAAFQHWESRYEYMPPVDLYLDRFTGSGYYFMWPFKGNMTKRLKKMYDKIYDNSILKDKTYSIVHDWTIYFGRPNIYSMDKNK